MAFGRAFIANPDLPRRLREGAPLNGLLSEANPCGLMTRIEGEW